MNNETWMLLRNGVKNYGSLIHIWQKDLSAKHAQLVLLAIIVSAPFGP